MVPSALGTALPWVGAVPIETPRLVVESSGSLSLARTGMSTGAPLVVLAVSATARGAELTISAAVAASFDDLPSRPVPDPLGVAVADAAAVALAVAGIDTVARLPSASGPSAQVTTAADAVQPAG